jgi:hypothetical protein
MPATEEMKKSRVLNRVPVLHPIDDQLWEGVELSCSFCDGSEWVRVTDIYTNEPLPTPDYHACLNCRT